MAGQAAMESSRFEEAANHLRSALKLGPRTPDEEAVIRVELSEALGKRGLSREQLEAVTKYDKASEVARLTDKNQMLVLIRLGWAYSFNNDVPQAIARFNQAMKLARRLNDDAGVGACYFGLARAYRNVNEVRIARDHYSSALEHYRRVGNWRELAESYINIGYINAFEGNYRNALQSLKQALSIIGERNEYDLLGRAYMYVAITHDNLGSTGKALESWERCIAHFQKAGNTMYLAMNENNLANKLVWLGQWSRAEALAKSAIEKLKKTTGIASLGGALDTLAQVYILMGRLDDADNLLAESLRVLGSIKTGEWAEVSTRTSIARSHLFKDRPDLAIEPLERAIDICLRSGTHYSLPEAKLWLAETMLATGRIDQARQIVKETREGLRDAPNLIAWGLMMRMVAKIEAADGHIAAAIQSLGQSSSIYEIRENVYGRAVNQVVLAGMLETQGRIGDADQLVKSALDVFKRLGAVIDERNATEYLAALNRKSVQADAALASVPATVAVTPDELVSATLPEMVPATIPDVVKISQTNPDLASAVDGFIARRLVQASVSKELLLHELAVVVQEQAASRAVLVGEIEPEGFRVGAAAGLTESEKGKELELLARLPREQYERRFAYPFSDNLQSNYVLYIIEPRAPRFKLGTVNLQPLLCLAEQGLETQVLRSRNRRTQVFDPAELLSDVELPGFICASRAMSKVLEQIHKIRSSDVTVLITGESGTGKELVARAVHASSSRRSGRFLPFNCSAAPREMVESQLFGHRKGAFTGAVSSYEGVIRAAERGTLFLDEIGDLPLEVQPKLLRFLQEGEIHPLGESHPLHVDVRVIAATNSDLDRTVAAGRFREDLFHRLNVIRVHIPPLRERREEIPTLINHYLNTYQQEAAKTEIRLSEEVVDLMVVYDWPGNVRQLCNELRRIVAYTESSTIATTEVLSPEVAKITKELGSGSLRRRFGVPLLPPAENVTLAEAITEIERRMIREALERSSGNIARAAKQLGLSRKGLYLKMDRLNFNN